MKLLRSRVGIFKLMIIMSIVGAAAVIPCHAEEQCADEDLRTFDGKVVNVDTSNSILTVSGVNQIAFPVSSDTKLQKSDFAGRSADIKLSDINIGDYVTVQYCRSGDKSQVPAKVFAVTVEYASVKD